jgi:hypothetical protein
MVDCAVCGRYVDENSWAVVSNNVRGSRRYLHDECRKRLIATRNQSDRFACPHCRRDYTPDTFPFAYTFIPGGMGDGGGAWKLDDQVCPHCQDRLPANIFKVCKFCCGGKEVGLVELVVSLNSPVPDRWPRYGLPRFAV